MQTVDLLGRIGAIAVVLLCVVLLARQFIGAPRRYRLDAMLRRTTHGLRSAAMRLYHWPAARRAARREAEKAIRRARGDDSERDGNVIRPKAFRKPRKLH
jgi:hypothetical protein